MQHIRFDLFIVRLCMIITFVGTCIIGYINIRAWQLQVWRPDMGVMFWLSLGNSALVSVVHTVLVEFFRGRPRIHTRRNRPVAEKPKRLYN